MRVLRAVISDSAAWRERSQAGGDPCDNHLTKSAHPCHPRAIGKKVGAQSRQKFLKRSGANSA